MLQSNSVGQSPFAAVPPGHPALLGGTLWQERAGALAPRLPVPPTPLLGRDRDRDAVTALLQSTDTRLVTLYGPGGVGKTRLALAVADRLADYFPDGVYLVPLADITEAALFPTAIAQALELYTLAGESVLATLLATMRDMSALLVLDNFEQILAAAPLLGTLLAGCPRLRLLVTSRAVLNLRGERPVPVEPLSLPAPGRADDLARIESSPAVALFLQHARFVRQDFVLDSGNAPVIAEICARLDGLPLAIELAAARVKLLSPRALLARLEKRLQILTGGAHDLPARQQTLHNTIAWSYELLGEAEQRLLRRLAVFAGGCTLVAATALCAQLDAEARGTATGLDVLDLATVLVNQSLLRVMEHDGDEPRLLLLETVREFAGERLRELGEEAAAQAAHAHLVQALAVEAEPQLRGPDQGHWLRLLERELGNVRAALDWSISGTDPADAAARHVVGLTIAGVLNRFWQARGHLQEASDRLAILLTQTTTERTPARDRALRTAARLAFNLVQMDAARDLYMEGLMRAREQDDRNAIIITLLGLGNVVSEVGDLAEAQRLYEECLSLSTELDQPSSIASALNNLGLLAMHRQDYRTAIRYLHEGAELYRRVGDPERQAMALDSLGRAHLRGGDAERGERYVREGLALNLGIGDQWNIAYGLVSLAEIAGARRDYGRATRLLATAEATYDDLLVRLDAHDQATYTACLRAAQVALGTAAFAATWAAGLRLTPAEALAQADGTPLLSPALPPLISAPAQPDPGLSAREGEVLALLATGLANAEIAERLTLSLYTVNAHLRNIYGKLNVTSRAAATRYAVEHSLT